MSYFEYDKAHLSDILRRTQEIAETFVNGLDERPVAHKPQPGQQEQLPEQGIGAQQALERFMKRYGKGLSGSSGGRYYGFVTGGTTPAALAGDWLTSVFDQNATSYGDSISPLVELEAIYFLRELFALPHDFSGIFVSGATMSNVSALALARQWVAKQQGIDIAQDGLNFPMRVLSGSPHSSVYKALAILGIGRANLTQVDCLAGREAVDVAALERVLRTQQQPCIVVANAGTVTTVDYDAMTSIAELKEYYPFWLHIDAAFGGFAAVSPTTAHLLRGWEQADSITIDAHKWLNVPYDSGMMFTRWSDLQSEVFRNAAVYLGDPSEEPNFVHRTPENSRRFRALAAWMTLMAYGKEGYREMVERHCNLAQQMGDWLVSSEVFELLAPVRMNGLCFTLRGQPDLATIQNYLDRLRDRGKVFLSPSQLFGQAVIRISISNWQSSADDIAIAFKDMEALAYEFIS